MSNISISPLGRHNIRPKGVPSTTDFGMFMHDMQSRFTQLTIAQPIQIFTVDTSKLWGLYLKSFSVHDRQYHNCHCCKNFIERFGGLVIIQDGKTKSLMWDASIAPDYYAFVVEKLKKAVERSKITNQFFSSDKQWGVDQAGGWNHFAVTPNRALVHQDRLVTAGQAEAAQLEEFRLLCEAIIEYSPTVTSTALDLLKHDGFFRAERVIGQMAWFNDLVQAKSKINHNFIWQAVASVPKGWCHIRQGVLGTMLDDLKAGKSVVVVKRNFGMKMDLLQYQRQTAAPTAGNAKRADDIVEQLGLFQSFARRFATIQDVKCLWKPIIKRNNGAGMFSVDLMHRINTSSLNVIAQTERITLNRFVTKVLPEAQSIKILVPSRGAFCAFTTAQHADAPPILQWDFEQDRNPIAWYFYHGGSVAEAWGLVSGSFAEVRGIAYQPNMLAGLDHQGHGVMFIIDKAYDRNNSNSALFPETLKSELREIRSSVEAYSMQHKLQVPHGVLASGIMSRFSRADETVTVRVQTKTYLKVYTIDRWD